MTRITMVGAGVMGTALMFPAADNGHEIKLVGTHLDADIIKRLKQDHFHTRLRRQIPNTITPHFHTEIAEAMVDVDIIGIGVNSRGVHWVAEQIAPHLKPDQIVMMVTKGLESSDTGELIILPDVLHDLLPSPIRGQVRYAAIGGPSIAGELAARRHTTVVFTSRNAEILPILQSIFATPYYHIWTSTDVIGVEVCVALKNPYALAVGLAAGVVEAETPPDIAGAKMHNFAASIFAQGLAETAYLVQHLGGSLETVFSLPGAGDLYVTTQGGRNSRMGRLLGMGKLYSDAVEEMPNETIEGVDAVVAIAPAVEQMIAAGKIAPDALPLLRKLHCIVTRGEKAEFDLDGFFSKLNFNAPKPIEEP
jgi:glycerol-3-phosphate dehydrogenase (NAD(P)+)